jgi:iron complex transport system ATP-binding protein
VTALLQGDALSFAFGAHKVLDRVSLSLEPGQLLVVVGPNGAGKTTLVRALAGLLSLHAGSVSLGGMSIERVSRRAIARQLAVVPQEASVPFPFQVWEMVAMGRAPYLGALGREGREDRDIIQRALEELGLAAFVERLYPTLSGGEKQRVLLARALAQCSDVLLLDEPTAHMDLGHRMHTFEWLRGWLAEGAQSRGAILVTHDLVLGARFADELLLMDRGQVVASGEPGAVLTRERIARVYGVEATVTRDASNRIVIHPERSRFESRFGYPPPP